MRKDAASKILSPSDPLSVSSADLEEANRSQRSETVGEFTLQGLVGGVELGGELTKAGTGAVNEVLRGADAIRGVGRATAHELVSVVGAVGAKPTEVANLCKRTTRSEKETSSAPAHPLQMLHTFDGFPAGYGAIRFPASPRPPSRWVRMSSKSNPETIVRLLTETLEFPAPCAVISIVGSELGVADLESSKLCKNGFSEHHELIFRQGLAEAVGKANAWVVTGGGRDGIASTVASALQALPVEPPILGILPWENIPVSERDQLADARPGQVHLYGSSSAVAGGHRHGSISGRSRRRSTVSAGISMEDPRNLDPNHSAFLLVDNGSKGDPSGQQLDLRHRLETFITSNDLSQDGVRTPTVVLLVGGGLEELRVVERKLLDKGPVFVFADSGGVAGELFRSEIFREEGTVPELDSMDPAIFRNPAEQSEGRSLIARILEHGLYRGYNNVSRLQFFHMPAQGERDDANLGLAILHAILNDLPTRYMELKLSVTWAVESILREVLEHEPTKDDEDTRPGLTIALEMALEKKDATLIRCLMECGAQPKMVDPRKLFLRAVDRYGVVASTKSRVCSPKICKMLTVIPGYKEHLERRMAVDEPLAVPPSPGLDLHLQIIPSRWTDLMMWAICMGEHELGEVLWSRSNDPLRAALLASQLCRRLSKQPNLVSESSQLEEQADHYEDLGIGLLGSFADEEDALVSLALLPCTFDADTPKQMWDESSMDCAALDDGRLSVPCKRLVAHPIAQRLLEGWYTGHYPGSRAAIYPGSSNLAVLLQAMCFLLPGTICEVQPPCVPGRGEGNKSNTSSDSVFDLSSTQTPRSAGKDDDDAKDAIEWGAGNGFASAGNKLEMVHSRLVSAARSRQERSFRDVIDDLGSGRWYEYFNVRPHPNRPSPPHTLSSFGHWYASASMCAPQPHTRPHLPYLAGAASQVCGVYGVSRILPLALLVYGPREQGVKVQWAALPRRGHHRAGRLDVDRVLTDRRAAPVAEL